jgi:hypothetical protein
VGALQESRCWNVRLQVWNGVEYPQSRGFTILADSTDHLCSNVFHWLGITAPYAALSEELEGTYPVKIERFTSASSAPAEAVLVAVSKLNGTGKDLHELAVHLEAEASHSA